MGKLKDNIYSLKREIAKRIITGNLGTIEEYEDRFLCTISKKPRKDKLKCHDVNNYPNLIRKYNLNKPITYIFNGIDFKNERCVIEGNSDINFLFINCSFGDGLNIDMCDSLRIIHSSIGKELRVVADTVSLSNVYNKSGKCLTLDIDIDANDVTIEESDFAEKGNKLEQAHFYINARNNLTLRRSHLGRQNNNDIVEIYTDTLTSDNSTFATPVPNKNPQYLMNKSHTMISAISEIKLYGNTDEMGNILIDSPSILVNGTRYRINESYNQSIYPEVNLQRIINPVSVKKLQLIEQLKKLRTKCEKRYNEKIKEYEAKLNREPLKRLLEK